MRPELRERVEQAARELDYQPHTAAQTMARGHSNSVGLIVNDITDPFFAAVAAGADTGAVTEGAPARTRLRTRVCGKSFSIPKPPA